MFEDLQFPTSLGSDNHSGVHPRVMAAMLEANRGHAHAYGRDELCVKTEAEFKRIFGPSVEPHYVFTGTAANVLALSASVKSFEAVICSQMAHLHVDECGAPEKFLGAKLWTLPSSDGRISPTQCAEVLQRLGDQHFSQPSAVSLTQPTEVGTCYSLEELRAWREFTRSKNLMLHLDGARLANAAAFLNCSLRELTSDIGVDSVSLGGTKNGLMGAEAVLLFTPRAQQNFKFYRKQAMQLSSKTRFLAAQFFAYWQDDLWLQIARHTTQMARQLAERLARFPEVRLAYPVESNALFVELPRSWLGPLKEHFFFYIWDSKRNLARWMISFDWTESDSDRLIATLDEVKNAL